MKEFDFQEYIEKYLSNITVEFGDKFPTKSEEYDLIILWNYKKIISNINNKKNIIVFHASDLPKGKGWAPIYYSIVNKDKYFTITGILASNQVDSGDVIVKAKFKMRVNYTATIIRQFSKEIEILLIKKLLERFSNNKIVGKKQHGQGTFYKRRKPEDNEIDINLKFVDLFDHLRACEDQHPAFFMYKNKKYLIKIMPEEIPNFPEDLEIIF